MNVRQKIALFLAIIYLSGISGLALNLHFCSGKLDEVALFSSQVSCKMCNKSEAANKKDDCCKASKVDLQLHDNHQAAANNELSAVMAFQLPPAYNIPVWAMQTATEEVPLITDKVPPYRGSQPVHILHCTFRI